MKTAATKVKEIQRAWHQVDVAGQKPRGGASHLKKKPFLLF